MKRNKIIVLLLALICVSLVFVACDEAIPAETSVEQSNKPAIVVTLDINEYTMNPGDNVQITANRQCNWSVSDGDVLSVDSNGLVTALAVGRANVIAEYEGVTASSSITVTDEYLGEPTLVADFKGDRLLVSEFTEVYPQVSFGKRVADNDKLSFSVTSSDNNVISVDGFRLTGVGAGSAVITVTLNYKGHNYSVNKTLSVSEISDIWFEDEEVSAIINNELSLAVKGVFPEANGVSKVRYSSSDNSVLKYENGKFKTLKTGTATVTANYNGLTATCKVYVCNIISTPKQFVKIFDNPNGNYILMADIDLSDYDMRKYRKDFGGYLDGNGNSILGLVFNDWQSYLFKTLTGTVKNIYFKNASFGGSNPLTQSGLIAHTLDGARIENCRVEVKFNQVGSGDYEWGKYLSWGQLAGGIASYCDSAYIKDCYVAVTTPHNSADDYIGAVVGVNRGELTLDNVIVEKAGDVDYCCRNVGSTSRINGSGIYYAAVANRMAEIGFDSNCWANNGGITTLKKGIKTFDNLASYTVLTELKNLNDDGYKLISSETIYCPANTSVTLETPTDEIYGFTFDSNSSVMSATINSNDTKLYLRYDRKEFTVKLTANGRTESKMFKYGQECDTSKDFSLSPAAVPGKIFIGYGKNAVEVFEVTEDYEGSAVYATPISTVEQFLAIKSDLSGNYVLTASLDFNDVNYSMIEGEFTGIIDGDGYTIKNLKLEKLKSDNVWDHTTALFRRFSGTIKDIGFENATIYVENNVVNCGLISSVFTGYADSIYADVRFTRTYYQWNTQQSGGLFGRVEGGAILNCFVSCVTDGAYVTGSIAGVVNGEVLINRIVIPSNSNTSVFAAVNGTQTVNRVTCLQAKQAQETIELLLIDDKQVIIETAGEILSSTWTCDGIQLPYLKNMQKMVRHEVSTFEQFVSTIRENNNAYVVLTDDIIYNDELVTAVEGVKVISINFYGVIDGQGHTFKSVALNAGNGSDMRLFRFFSGTIKNIAIEASMQNGDGQTSAAGVIALEFSGVAENIKLTLRVHQIYMRQGNDTQQSGGLFGRLANGALIRNVLIDFTAAAGDGNVTGFGYVAGFVKANASVTITNVVVVNRGEKVRPIIALVYDGSKINGEELTYKRYHASDDNANTINGTIITNALVGNEATVISGSGAILGSAWVCDGTALPYLLA